MALTEDQVRRYARHILLPDVGGRGQERLLAACVAVDVGPGHGAEVAALAYLAAAGVGRLRLLGDTEGPVTRDDVAGGILFGAGDVGRPRSRALRDRLAGINPDVDVTAAADPAGHVLVVDGGTGACADALIAGCGAATRMLATLLEPPA